MGIEGIEYLITIGDECFTNGEVISYKGENYYKACDTPVKNNEDGSTSHCVRRVGHPGLLHEAYDGSVSTGLES